jgi:hypothetical protein
LAKNGRTEAIHTRDRNCGQTQRTADDDVVDGGNQQQQTVGSPQISDHTVVVRDHICWSLVAEQDAIRQQAVKRQSVCCIQQQEHGTGGEPRR